MAAKSTKDSGVGIGRNALMKSPLKGGVGSMFAASAESAESVNVVSMLSMVLVMSCC